MKIKNISVGYFLQLAFFTQIQYFRESSCFDVLTQTKPILFVEFPTKLKWQQVNRMIQDNGRKQEEPDEQTRLTDSTSSSCSWPYLSPAHSCGRSPVVGERKVSPGFS